MTSLDSDSRYHPQGSEVGQEPRWILLTRGMFPTGSTGDVIFPKDLEGRLRPEIIFKQPVLGSQTAGDLLNLSWADFAKLPRWRDIRTRLSEYLADQFVLPHAKLLEDIFREPQIPVDPKREPEIIRAVEQALGSLAARDARVLRLRYGIGDWKHTLVEVAEEIAAPAGHLSRERVREIQAKAIRKLRHPSQELKGVLTLPEQSLGREFFGAVLRKDLPCLPQEPIGQLALSESTWKELEINGLAGYLCDSLVKIDLERKLSPEARCELATALKEKAEALSLARQAAELVRLLDKEIEIKQKPSINALFPEIPLTEEQLRALGGMGLETISLSYRVFNALKRGLSVATIGQLLDCSPERLTEVRQLGPLGLKELGDKLEGFIPLPEGCPEGYIAGLLVSMLEKYPKKARLW